MPMSLRNEDGMTLAEVLAAAAVVGIGLVALASAIPLAAYGIQEGNQLSTATFLASQRMEQVRSASWTTSPAADNLGSSPSTLTAPQSGGATTFPDEISLAAPYAGYARTVRIRDCSLAGGCSGVQDAGLRQISVTVAYAPMTGIGQTPAGATKSAVLTMLVSKR